MKKYLTIAKFLVAIVAAIIIISCCSYNYGISPVSKSTEDVIIKIEENSTYLSIAELLKEKNLIRSISFYKVYIKIFNPNELYSGTYILNENMGVKNIVKSLSHETNYNPDQVTILFREGLNMRAIANLIANNTNNTVNDVYSLLSDTTYIDELINNYWFLTNDIKDENIYYSLEGYLFPDTYTFVNKDVSVKEIFKVMLDEMNNKLEPFKDKIKSSDYSIHKLFTLASIVELEGTSSTDRASVAGVFYNRLKHNWTLGSDVTTYYAEKIDDWSKGLTSTQLNNCNAYNTRGTCFNGLPVGPICNPSLDSIKAVIEPNDNDYYYFVADCSGKTYLNYTESEHNATKNKLINEGNWCDN